MFLQALIQRTRDIFLTESLLIDPEGNKKDNTCKTENSLTERKQFCLQALFLDSYNSTVLDLTLKLELLLVVGWNQVVVSPWVQFAQTSRKPKSLGATYMAQVIELDLLPLDAIFRYLNVSGKCFWIRSCWLLELLSQWYEGRSSAAMELWFPSQVSSSASLMLLAN